VANWTFYRYSKLRIANFEPLSVSTMFSKFEVRLSKVSAMFQVRNAKYNFRKVGTKFHVRGTISESEYLQNEVRLFEARTIFEVRSIRKLSMISRTRVRKCPNEEVACESQHVKVTPLNERGH
jgi:hypothetical protein